MSKLDGAFDGPNLVVSYDQNPPGESAEQPGDSNPDNNENPGAEDDAVNNGNPSAENEINNNENPADIPDSPPPDP